ncbi:uncharacterized protein OCT59_015505 [Rhizophagus irregularis]|uniref:uncharacterized protein n=1 Tax=Rhizophagus irregularis TaxID=588596 RepID=UPI003319B026|nr:hypothetical protein OCT59_015505 [Rhizophagus irregularis]
MWVVWVGSAGGLGVWECGLGVGVGVGVGVWVGSVDLLLGPFSFRLSLGLPSLCLGLLFIRSSFRPFFFSSLFRYVGSVGWECGSVGVWVGSAGVWECGLGVRVGVGVWECGVWECGLGVRVGVGVWVGVWEWVVWECLPSLCLGLLFIRSSFRPFFFSSLFRFIFSPSRSSLSFFTSSFHTNSVLPGTLYHRSTR